MKHTEALPRSAVLETDPPIPAHQSPSFFSLLQLCTHLSPHLPHNTTGGPPWQNTPTQGLAVLREAENQKWCWKSWYLGSEMGEGQRVGRTTQWGDPPPTGGCGASSTGCWQQNISQLWGGGGVGGEPANNATMDRRVNCILIHSNYETL